MSIGCIPGTCILFPHTASERQNEGGPTAACAEWNKLQLATPESSIQLSVCLYFCWIELGSFYCIVNMFKMGMLTKILREDDVSLETVSHIGYILGEDLFFCLAGRR